VFYREYVAMNRPCLINGLSDGWPAHAKWSAEYLSATLGDKPISVEVTPDGRGDALVRTALHAVFGFTRCHKETMSNEQHVVAACTALPDQFVALATVPMLTSLVSTGDALVSTGY
jgi:hypothetical protein